MPLHTYAFYTLFAPAAAIAAVIGPLFQDFVSASTASIDENMRKVVREMTISSPTKRKSDETPMKRLDLTLRLIISQFSPCTQVWVCGCNVTTSPNNVH